jgi:hypothetical protein
MVRSTTIFARCRPLVRSAGIPACGFAELPSSVNPNLPSSAAPLPGAGNWRLESRQNPHAGKRALHRSP